MIPPRLNNDCFALPRGVTWTPVSDALEMLRTRLSCLVGHEDITTPDAAGRITAAPIFANRTSPPSANSAVDGYGLATASLDPEVTILPLVDGRSAAGQPYEGRVPAGRAIRILTGATVPAGVDTIVMQEDIALEDGKIAFRGGLKKGANIRKAGEDVTRGAEVLPAGHRLLATDVALLIAAGVAKIAVYRKLKVGVLSTGDEVRPIGTTATPDQIYDVNRPMLLSILAGWGVEAVDLGHVGDTRDILRQRLDKAAGEVDAIFTSGGASAGDEDHMSALLSSEGNVHFWRIAIKPGRPLALGQWQGVPVFGLPGNPVAAFVCALVFARPAVGVLAGKTWQMPRGYMVPAGFSKDKKAGRREYLRARINSDGQAEVFHSEGSGLVSGLSWADGLVELGDGAATITPQTPVLFYPYCAFGL